MLYELATATPPFSGETSGAIFDAILHKSPSALTRLNPEVPGELDRIIARGLEKDGNVRYQHASEIRTDLERLKWETDVLGQTSSNHKSYPEVCRFNDPTWPTGSPEMCGKTIRGPGEPRQSASLR